ncbi:hypothetical protein [Microviridae sp.]|nr:hypothetical protein [Microviridae sp.]
MHRTSKKEPGGMPARIIAPGVYRPPGPVDNKVAYWSAQRGALEPPTLPPSRGSSP